MSAERLIANYLRIAHEDLAGAELLSRAGNRNAAYLCEQAAEKLLRAVLTSEGTHGGPGHRLGIMLNQVPKENPTWPALAELVELESYARTYRYPTSHRVLPSPTDDELRPLLDKVRDVHQRLVAWFDVDLSDPRRPARRADPPR